jgi:hypothetical protein
MVYVLLCMYEYGVLKSVKVILRMESHFKGRGRILEEINQTGVYYLYIWKGHNEILCTTIIY